MGYYQGDFYRGARGDPGFFSFLKGVGSSLASFIPGVGPIASKAIAAIPTPVKAASQAIVKVAATHPAITAAGAAGLTGLAAGALSGKMRGAPSAAGMASVSRMRGGGGKRRRMRVTNPKALRRALRRAYGFERLAMRTIHLLHPKKKGRFGGFRRPKKRAA